MIKFFIIIITFVFFISCGEVMDEKFIDWQELIVNCYPSEFEIKDITYCDSAINNDPSICEYKNFGEIFLLSDTRQHSKYMCSLMQSVTFENDHGEELVFEKTAFAAQYATQWSEPCDSNPEKSVLFCSSNEEATAILKNDSTGLEFRIMLIVVDRYEDNMENDRDRMFITIPKKADFGVYYTSVLSYYIKRGNVYEAFDSRFIYEEQFQLNGETYQDVTYFIPTENSKNLIEIYYAVKLGIIAFRDENNVLWTFKSFG